MTAPCASVTVPLMVPVSDWPKPTMLIRMTKSSTREAVKNDFFIGSSSTKVCECLGVTAQIRADIGDFVYRPEVFRREAAVEGKILQSRFFAHEPLLCPAFSFVARPTFFHNNANTHLTPRANSPSVAQAYALMLQCP